MIHNDSFCFSEDKFSKLFPFFMLFNKENRIVSHGKSLAKICKIENGRCFSEFFTLKRPSFNTPELDVLQLIDQMILLECRVNPKIILRGQFEFTADHHVVFIGTPWFGSMDEVVENNLAIYDFAMHDPMIDLLHVLKSQEITTNEIKELLTRVNQQKNTLKESEKRVSSLVLNLQTGILLEDETRHIVLCNRMFCDIFKIPAQPETLTGADCSNAAETSKFMFKDPDAFAHRITTILQERKMVLSEKLELQDGRVLERDYMPIFVLDRYKGHLWKYTDITDRENIDRKLRKQEEKYRSIIENMKMGILEVDMKDQIQYVNSSFCQLSGYSASELIGKKAHELLATGNIEAIVEEKLALRKRGVSDGYELMIHDKRKRQRCWFISGAPNYNDKGELIGSIGIHLDVTEQRILEDELRVAKTKAEESSKAKESFLANMSHEIRTPLNAIIGMIRELNKMNLTDKQSKYLRHADSASQHLLSIINNILDISKIEAGEFQLDKQAFRLHSVFEETKAILDPAAQDKSLDLTFTLSENLRPAYVGDPHRIRQILLNIISNSIKFTEKGGIKMTCEAHETQNDNQQIRICIHDSGIGMDKSYLGTLFKKFSQEDISIARKHGGTGLGMAITYELVQMMNGSISVTSEKGVGTQFDICLNLNIADPNTFLANSQHDTTCDLNGLRVLLVEDNEMNRLVAINSLNHIGATVDEAVNGQEAVELLKHKAFDVILMDLQMPIMGGLEASNIIRQEMGIKTPIIALTANAFKNEIERCMLAGMDDYVTKPFDEALLIQAIQRSVGKKVKTGSAPLPQEETKTKLYNLDMLVKMGRGNSEFVEKMVELFCSGIPDSLNALISSWHSEDYQTLRLMAHKIKPTLDNFGVFILKEDIRVLESIDTENMIAEEIAAIIKRVEQTVTKVINDLSAGKR